MGQVLAPCPACGRMMDPNRTMCTLCAASATDRTVMDPPVPHPRPDPITAALRAFEKMPPNAQLAIVCVSIPAFVWLLALIPWAPRRLQIAPTTAPITVETKNGRTLTSEQIRERNAYIARAAAKERKAREKADREFWKITDRETRALAREQDREDRLAAREQQTTTSLPSSKGEIRPRESERGGSGLRLISETNNQLGIFGWHIKGIVENDTGKEFSYAQIEYNIYDSDGNQIGSAFDNISHLEAHGKWQFDAEVPSSNRGAASFKLKSLTGF